MNFSSSGQTGFYPHVTVVFHIEDPARADVFLMSDGFLSEKSVFLASPNSDGKNSDIETDNLREHRSSTAPVSCLIVVLEVLRL